MVNVHINNTKHITIANIYIPPRDSTSTHYKTADMTWTYNTAYRTSKHTTLSPHRRCECVLHSLALVR